MIPLSQAMIKGAAIAPANAREWNKYFDPHSCQWDASIRPPLGAAYIGHLHPGAIDSFWTMVRTSTEDSLCAHMLRGLHRAWPHIGSSVRAWPTLAAELEKREVIPVLKLWQTEYRQAVHVSLWKVICDLHAAGESKAEIAELLARHGL